MPVIRTQFTLRLDPVNHIKIKKIAEQESRSMSNMIEYLVKKEIERYESRNGEILISDDELYSE
ncbi:MAG: hypothetical protein IJL81_04630 [Clostridia bacterium]|nr:hypothetical protein [Clostridia bacterium]